MLARSNSGLKLHLTFSDAALNDFFFFFFQKFNLFYQKQCNDVISIGVFQFWSAHLGKSALFYLCNTLPSISKITPVKAIVWHLY